MNLGDTPTSDFAKPQWDHEPTISFLSGRLCYGKVKIAFYHTALLLIYFGTVGTGGWRSGMKIRR